MLQGIVNERRLIINYKIKNKIKGLNKSTIRRIKLLLMK